MELFSPSKLIFMGEATPKMLHDFIFYLAILMRRTYSKIIAAGGQDASTIKEPKHFIEKHDKPTYQFLSSFLLILVNVTTLAQTFYIII